MILRKAGIEDIELLIKLRLDYLLEDWGSLNPEEERLIAGQLRDYFPRHIPTGRFIGIIAQEGAEILGTAYLAIEEKPANPRFITGKTGTLLNVLTYPKYRRQGIATQIISKVMEEARLCGASSISLSATDAGKLLYEKLGFSQSKYTSMGIKLG